MRRASCRSSSCPARIGNPSPKGGVCVRLGLFVAMHRQLFSPTPAVRLVSLPKSIATRCPSQVNGFHASPPLESSACLKYATLGCPPQAIEFHVWVPLLRCDAGAEDRPPPVIVPSHASSLQQQSKPSDTTRITSSTSRLQASSAQTPMSESALVVLSSVSGHCTTAADASG